MSKASRPNRCFYTCTCTNIDDIDKDCGLLIHYVRQIGKSATLLTHNHVGLRISDATRKLLEKRRHADRTSSEFRTLCREVRAAVDADHKELKKRKLLAAAESRRSIKMTARDLAEYRSSIPSLKTASGERVMSRLRIEEEMKQFYSSLFHSLHPPVPRPSSPPNSIAPFLVSEVRSAVESIPSGKAPGEDGISAELLKACGHPLYVELANRFSRYL